MSDIDDDIRRRRDLDERERAIHHRHDVHTPQRRGGRPMTWILVLLVIAALVIGGFFLFGGDVDVDTEGGDVDVPAVDVDVESPDVSVNTPDVDVDPGSVDVEGDGADAGS